MKKQNILKALPFLLTALLAGVMYWVHDTFVYWVPIEFGIAIAVSVLLFAAIALTSGRKWPQALGWTAAFLAIGRGVTYLVNNVMYGASGGARPAMRVVLPLLALLTVLMLIKPWLAFDRRAKLASGVPALVLAVLAGVLILRNVDFGGGVHSPGAALAWSFTRSTEKIRQDERLGKMKTIHVTMGKNEREGFQFILRGRTNGAPQYCIELSGVANENGGTIPARMFKAHYIFAGEGKDAGIYPDALIPYPLNQNKLEIAAAHTNQGYYFELRTDADTPAGVYTGIITVSRRREGEGYVWETLETLAQAAFTVEVVDVTFPDSATGDSAVGLGGGEFYRLGGAEPGTPEAAALYKQYYDYLLDHKLSAYSLPYDILDPLADAYMSDPRVKSFQIPYPEDDERLLAYYQKIQSNPDWARKAFFYPIDEPHTAEQIRAYSEMTERLAALCPGYNMVTPFYTWKFNNEGGSYDNLAIQDGRSNMICPISDKFDDRGFPEAVQRRVNENGDRAWWYVCVGPGGDYCNMFIPYQGTRHRLLFWQQYQQDITGLLYWHTSYWEKANPWFSSVTWNSYTACGDGSWLYPSPAVGLKEPVPSLRLKNIADGLEDYDLLKMAEGRFGRDYCVDKAARLSRTLTDYTQDPAKLERVRAEILRDLAGKK